ncbi:hypothetical protein HMJ29_17735 [Hymenobacter taeanensis]|uniref:Uncharacterized protein n=1 Tax=Hymenobacter taeanensis TaxID=2735321 RepID=A0A6M6BL13_9BACT|nr:MULTISPECIES: hypothetical protein [Hymenobacter]QJX48659.1 hypothetical protein HMJ29_17735 [Hymenobacter taeanensis]UOQ81842.1 hypothetical protein MUN83_03355 [Hymenobacter sp. 5414T-23]
MPAYAQNTDVGLRRVLTDLDKLNATAKRDIEKLDKLAENPFAKQMVTSRAFSKLIYKDQQSIGGSIIREGKVIGFNATVEESAVTVNGGTPVYWKKVAFQANLRGSSEDGFVNVFSDGDYQKTLSIGGTVLLFLPWNKSRYMEAERLRLHSELRTKRFQNEGQFAAQFPGQTGNSKKWATPTVPNDEATWKVTQSALITDFINKRTAFHMTGLRGDADWIKRFYKDELTDAEAKDPVARSSYRAYLLAEQQIKQILSANWPAWGKKKEDEYIRDSLQTNLDRYLQVRYRQDTYRKYKQSLALYDTVQAKSTWSHRYRNWFSLKASYNNAKQPLFDPTLPDKAYKRTYDDEYGEFQVAFNHLAIHTKSKNYVSAGVGISNKLDFIKDNQRTYQVTTQQPNGTGFIEVVKQSTAYPELPKEVTVKTVQLQAATYWTKTIGVDLSYKGKFAKDYTDKNEAYLGVFFPINAGESTLLFMPQLKWADVKEPKPWSFGFNLSASLPGFVTKDK